MGRFTVYKSGAYGALYHSRVYAVLIQGFLCISPGFITPGFIVHYSRVYCVLCTAAITMYYFRFYNVLLYITLRFTVYYSRFYCVLLQRLLCITSGFTPLLLQGLLCIIQCFTVYYPRVHCALA